MNIFQVSIKGVVDTIDFMHIALDEASQGVKKGDGGPFGAVIVKEGNVISLGHNMVISNCDSTAHAEIIAIRKAEQILGTYDLSGCVLYSTCYPCPMCLGAIMWARISKVYYACRPEDAAAIGFDDKVFYEAIANPNNNEIVPLEHLYSAECLALFNEWTKIEDRKLY